MGKTYTCLRYDLFRVQIEDKYHHGYKINKYTYNYSLDKLEHNWNNITWATCIEVENGCKSLHLILKQWFIITVLICSYISFQMLPHQTSSCIQHNSCSGFSQKCLALSSLGREFHKWTTYNLYWSEKYKLV